MILEKKTLEIRISLKEHLEHICLGLRTFDVLEALVYGKVTVLSPRPPSFPFLLTVSPTAGIPTVAPPLVRPTPRPDVIPPSVGTFLLYAQGQQIGYLPLSGTRLQKDTARTLLSLHVKRISRVGRGCVGVQIWGGA